MHTTFRNSASKRLENMLKESEQTSDKKISLDHYYIVTIIPQKPISDYNALKEYVKSILKVKKGVIAPLIAYISDLSIDISSSLGTFNGIHFIYSSVDENESHLFGGSHQSIVSEFTSIFCIRFGIKFQTRIVEFDNRFSILTFLQSCIKENITKCIVSISKNTIDYQKAKKQTYTELISLLKMHDVNWDDISAEKRYGIMYKYIPGMVQRKSNKNNEKIESQEKYIKLAESIDPNQIEKYTSFIFG